MSVIDRDRGYAAALAGFSKMHGAEIEIGVDDAEAARYGAVLEAEHAWMRDAIDGLDVDAELGTLVDGVLDGEASLDGLSTAAQEAVRERIEKLGLVDTGRLRDSVRRVRREE